VNPAIQYATTEDSAKIAYLRVGEGDPIVFASNVWGDAHLYISSEPYIHKVVDSLVAFGWQVILFDGRGMGASDRQALDFGVTARKRDLAAVVAKLAYDEFVLAAYDIAGPTAIAYAAEERTRVSRLVLLNANASTAMRRQTSSPLRTIHPVEVLTAEDWEFRTLTLASVDTKFSDADKAHEVAAMFRAGMSPDAFQAYVQANSSLEVTNLLSVLAMPTLVVHDKSGPFGSFESSQNLAAYIRGARLLTVDDAASAINEFLVSSLVPPQKAIESQTDGRSPAKKVSYPNGLSDREIEVLRLVAAGKSNPQIADALVISLNTVQRHVSNILAKTGLVNRTEAASYAHRHELT
jgi:DNA-binding NarL/FixJ family response regulator